MSTALREVAAGNIRAEAARAGINQSELARRLGLDSTAVSRRWYGKQPWTLDLIDEVAGILHVPTLDLLRARRDSNPQPSDPEDTQPMLDLGEPSDTSHQEREELPAAA